MQANKEAMSTQKAIVTIKVGTSMISNGEEIFIYRIRALCELISELKTHYHILLVSSGAVASGYINCKIDKRKWANKQALASIGQPLLMENYINCFKEFSNTCAQVLIAGHNIKDLDQSQNIRNCINALLAYDVVPIINENDSVALEEFVGDNDRLGAMVNVHFGGRLLVILSDIDGYYDANPRTESSANILSIVNNIDTSILQAKFNPNAEFATGGITTKLLAAHYLLERGNSMYLNSWENLDSVRTLLVDKKQKGGTLFSKHTISQIL